MNTFKNLKFCLVVQGAPMLRNIGAETEIVRFCTARLRAPRNAAMPAEDKFVGVF